MTAPQLLLALARDGVTVTRRGPDITLSGPSGALVEEVLELVRDHKATILIHLPFEGAMWPPYALCGSCCCTTVCRPLPPGWRALYRPSRTEAAS